METHKIFSGLAGWTLLIALCIYAWFISYKSAPAVPLSSDNSGYYTTVQTLPVVPVTWQLTGQGSLTTALSFTHSGTVAGLK